MIREQERFAAAAAALAGTPFRFRGRDRETGLDCVGLVLAALADCGRTAPRLGGYAMRQAGIPDAGEAIRAAGFAAASGAAQAGDVLLARAGPAQLHVLVCARGGFVHAHAGLGRVVLTPPPCPWPILHHWRLARDQGMD